MASFGDTTHDRPARVDDLLGSSLMSSLDKLDIIARKIFSGKIQGERRSRRRGISVEFADYRQYAAGDDLRYQRRYRLEASELRRLLGEAFWRHVEQLVSPSELDKVTAQLARRELDPYTAVDAIMERALAQRDADRNS